MKKAIAIIGAVLCLIAFMAAPVWAADFKDVKDGDWFAKAVNYCSENHYMEGMGDGYFGPQVEISRAMVVTVLYRMAGAPEMEGTNPFNDVEAGKWYEAGCIWGAGAGIVAGYEDGSFRPEQSVSRQELMCFVTRYLKHENIGTEYLEDTRIFKAFPDCGKAASWAVDGITGCTSSGVVCGSDGMLEPNGVGTRAQLAVILTNIDSLKSGKMGTVTTSAEANGSVAPAGTLTVLEGATVTVRPLPDEGYVTESITVNGAPQEVWEFVYVKATAEGATCSCSFKKLAENYASGYAQLVNRSYPIANAASYHPSDLKTVYKIGEQEIKLRAAAADALNLMLADFKKGHSDTLYPTSGYRTYDYQQMLYNNQINKQGGNKYKAGTISAVPGTSEHELGLAVDLTDGGGLIEQFGSTVQGQWLAAHCWEYGYILRYPTKDTQTVTGIIYEPWHFRYVGKEVSKEMHDMGVKTLEEYYGKYLRSEDLNPYLPYLQ